MIETTTVIVILFINFFFAVAIIAYLWYTHSTATVVVDHDNYKQVLKEKVALELKVRQLNNSLNTNARNLKIANSTVKSMKDELEQIYQNQNRYPENG